MSDLKQRRNPVYKSLHKPLTYLGIERKLYFFVCVAAVGCFNLFNSLIAGLVIFVGGAAIAYWMTNEDPAFLLILGKSEKFKPRYDASKQELPRLEIQ